MLQTHSFLVSNRLPEHLDFYAEEVGLLTCIIILLRMRILTKLSSASLLGVATVRDFLRQSPKDKKEVNIRRSSSFLNVLLDYITLFYIDLMQNG